MLSFFSLSCAAAHDTPSPMNVLMIAVDDLRNAGAAFGDPSVRMPNLDKLALRSVAFREAFVQAATCGVSRTSLLTGRRPDTTKVLGNGGCPFTNDPNHKDWQSIPQYFRLAGYTTAGFGKVFHPGVCDGADAGEQRAAWSETYFHAPCVSLGSIYNGTCYENNTGGTPHLPASAAGKVTSHYANGTLDAAEAMPDTMILERAVARIKELAGARAAASPFFLAVGFHKPHLPHIAPKEFFDLYPLDSIALPDDASLAAPQNAPKVAWNECGEFMSYHDVKKYFGQSRFNRDTPIANQTYLRMQRQAYYAAASYADDNIGKLLAALDASGFANNTVVALWGDHGWHLGENNEWAKRTAMTWANRAPLLFAVPGLTTAGAVSGDYAEFVDIFPTLADFAGIAVPPRCNTTLESARTAVCTEGASLKAVVQRLVPATRAARASGDGPASFEPLLTDSGKTAAFGQWAMNGRTGYIVHTRGAHGELLRYTEWVKGSTDGAVIVPTWTCTTPEQNASCAELYNRTADPNENVNIAQRGGAVDGVVQRLSKLLHDGWRAI